PEQWEVVREQVAGADGEQCVVAERDPPVVDRARRRDHDGNHRDRGRRHEECEGEPCRRSAHPPGAPFGIRGRRLRPPPPPPASLRSTGRTNRATVRRSQSWCSRAYRPKRLPHVELSSSQRWRVITSTSRDASSGFASRPAPAPWARVGSLPAARAASPRALSRSLPCSVYAAISVRRPSPPP